jgi:hypothetical protein
VRRGEHFSSPHYHQNHIVATDVTMAVCGRPTVGGTPTDAKTVCGRCKGVDYSATTARQEPVETWLARIAANTPERLPTNPQERQDVLQGLAKVEMVRKAFNAEVLI